MKQALISVIIPAYNIENYIDDCLESVVFQSYGNLEIIVINDGSTDKTLEKIERFASRDKRMTVVTEKNKGLSEARNKGLRLASGDYIAFVDGDDAIDTNYIKNLYEALKRADADISVCSYNGVRKAVKTETVLLRKEALSDFLTQRLGTSAVVWNKLYKREVLKGLKFPKDRLHEDNFFTPRALEKAKKVVIIPEKLYNYRISNGITSKMTKKRLKDALDSVKDARVFLKTKKLDGVLEKELEAYELNQKFYYFKLTKNTKLKVELKAKKREILKNPYASKRVKLFAIFL
jgi:glycosyltransferase involved in cell wall biosynthesis